MSESAVDLVGQNALVTGAGIGNGRLIALALAGGGASVAVSDINIERAEAVAEQIEAQGGQALALHADVSNRFQAANMIERARDAYGGVDILVNAAEVLHPEPLLRIDEWNWRRQLEVNVSGAFFCLQLVARVMADEGGGTIINLVPAEALGSTIESGIGYLTGKAGLLAMTRQAARELESQGICVSAIAYGLEGQDWNAPFEGDCNMRRYKGQGGIGGAARFLCSEAGRLISGRVLVVSGTQGDLDT